MAFVIAEPCTDVMDQACIRACPVACIHFDAGKDRKLYIDPAECIDCGACVPVCPVKAIYADYELPTCGGPFGSRLMYLDKGKFVRGISCQVPLSGFISWYSKYRHPIYRQFCDKARSSTS
jgi:NAD-dependent dihydropyrimidine dehydrogenase PreA subunit